MQLNQVTLAHEYSKNAMVGYVIYQDNDGNYCRLVINEDLTTRILELIRHKLPSAVYTDPWTNYTTTVPVDTAKTESVVGEG